MRKWSRRVLWEKPSFDYHNLINNEAPEEDDEADEEEEERAKHELLLF